jgi:iron(III) transport system permease protein
MAAAGTLADPGRDRRGRGDHDERGGGEQTTARRAGDRPVALFTVSCLVAALLALPLAFLLIEAHGAGVSEVAHLIFRPLTWSLLWNTVRLAVAVTAACAVIGTATAWCVERTDLPGRRAWAVLVVVPLAIPDFVVSFGWHSLWTWAHGFLGAVIVMTLAVYPLVYLPVAASLRMADPGQEEVARSLGVSRVKTFVKITLGQAKGAILGGCLLVTLVLLAEYGAFEILGYQTFTTEIFTEFNGYSFAASCALSLVLVLLSLLVLAGEGLINRNSGRVTRTGPLAQRVNPPQQLGWTRWPVLALFAALVLLALGLPVASTLYWMADGLPPALSGGANVSLLDAAGHTALYGGSAGVLATVLAFPVALLAVRHSGRVRHVLERSTYLVLGMPGVVIAFALSYFTEKYAAGFGYGTSLLLIACYAIMFFPLALVGVKASLARAPVGLDEVARSLGRRRVSVLFRVTVRLAGPGLVAAFCLVFLSVVTELTATLLLIPTGTQTLATQFWAYQSNLSYSQAAPFALVMIVVAAVPSYVLSRFFQRPGQAGG